VNGDLEMTALKSTDLTYSYCGLEVKVNNLMMIEEMQLPDQCQRYSL
tara:strand:- start:9118 stop:9258 length:141 start_codon:yes stop_codon:yes gene_type:complete